MFRSTGLRGPGRRRESLGRRESLAFVKAGFGCRLTVLCAARRPRYGARKQMPAYGDSIGRSCRRRYTAAGMRYIYG